MNTYEYFTVTETIGESKGKLATGIDSEADGLEPRELSAPVQEVWLPAAFNSLGTPIASLHQPPGKLVGTEQLGTHVHFKVLYPLLGYRKKVGETEM